MKWQMTLKERTELADHSGRWTRLRYKTSENYGGMTKAKIATYRYVLGEDWVFLQKGNPPEDMRVRVLSIKR